MQNTDKEMLFLFGTENYEQRTYYGQLTEIFSSDVARFNIELENAVLRYYNRRFYELVSFISESKSRTNENLSREMKNACIFDLFLE